MTQHIPHYINGKLLNAAGKQKLLVFNPALGERIAMTACATEEEVNQAVNAAKNAYSSWSQVTPLKRARVIFKFKELLEKNKEKVAALITREHGKVLDDALGEVQRAIELAEFSCGTPYLLKGSYSENVGTDVDSYTLKQPLGVCLGVTPFNFPVMISTWMFVPAIACGNTFILKPSEKDPSSTLYLCELMQEAGLPNGVLNLLNGDAEIVDSLISHPDIQAVTAVGSTAVAESIYQKSVKLGKRAHTFGGAKNHCVVMPDTNIDEAANHLLGAAFGAAGERCMAISVAITVTDTVADALVSRLKKSIPQLKIANGADKQVDMGPLITKEHAARVKSLVDDGITEGADLVVDGRHVKSDESGFFMGGCLFDHVTPKMKIYREEIFGPVLCIVRTHDFDSAIQLVNENPYGNGVSILTNDGGVARTFASKVTVGMVGINVPIPVPVAYHTFGGWKRSFFGDMPMHAEENVHFYTRSKTVTMRWPNSSKNMISYHMPSH